MRGLDVLISAAAVPSLGGDAPPTAAPLPVHVVSNNSPARLWEIATFVTATVAVLELFFLRRRK